MEFGIFNLMGSRDPAKPTAEVFAEVAEQTRVAHAVAVELDFVQPLVAFRRRADQLGKLWLDPLRQSGRG